MKEKDGYDLFFKEFKAVTYDKIWEFAEKTIVKADPTDAKNEWKKLKDSILEGSGPVYIRGYGRDAAGTEKILNFYKMIFENIKIQKDPTNNMYPTKMIEVLTKHYKKKKINNNEVHISNFQVSHVFGKTKNPFLFMAPWNVVFIPKILDPFTGHEAKGDMKEKFNKDFKKFIYARFSALIEDYNNLICLPKVKSKIDIALNKLDGRIVNDLKEQLKPIEIDFDISLSKNAS